jgi:hypothetical protein
VLHMIHPWREDGHVASALPGVAPPGRRLAITDEGRKSAIEALARARARGGARPAAPRPPTREWQRRRQKPESSTTRSTREWQRRQQLKKKQVEEARTKAAKDKVAVATPRRAVLGVQGSERNVSATKCGAMATLAPLPQPAALNLRASFRGHELTTKLLITEGQADPKGTSVLCEPPQVLVGQEVRCTIRAHDPFGNPLRGASLAAVGELHRMGEAGPLLDHDPSPGNSSAVERVVIFSALGAGRAGVVLYLANATKPHDVVTVRVRRKDKVD